MNRLFRTAAVLCLSFAAFAAPVWAQEPARATPTSVADAVLDHMEAGNFEAAVADFNGPMKQKVGAVQLAGVQQQLESAGALQSRSQPQVSQQQGHTVVVYRMQREHAAIDATIAIDGEGKVGGLHFSAATESADP